MKVYTPLNMCNNPGGDWNPVKGGQPNICTTVLTQWTRWFFSTSFEPNSCRLCDEVIITQHIYTMENWAAGTQSHGGGWKMMFLFIWVICRSVFSRSFFSGCNLGKWSAISLQKSWVARCINSPSTWPAEICSRSQQPHSLLLILTCRRLWTKSYSKTLHNSN